MSLGKYLEVRQPIAWRMLHRIRAVAKNTPPPFCEINEVDETCLGGKHKNLRNKKWIETRFTAGRGIASKFPVISIKNREPHQVVAQAFGTANHVTIHEFFDQKTSSDTVIYSDEHRGYNNLKRTHANVAHSKHQYTGGDIRINDIESFYTILERDYKGTYHYISRKYLQLYVYEFVKRYHTRGISMIKRMELFLCHRVL